MRLLLLLNVFLTVLILENKADIEIDASLIQEIVKDFSNIIYGTGYFEHVTCLPINTTSIKFLLYTPKNKQEAVLFKAGETNDLSLFDPSLETKIITHGWTDSSDSWSVIAKDEYLGVGDYNIILLDWSKYALHRYSKSVCYAKKIAEIAASLLIQIRNEANLNFKKTHVIGHSLGGQLAGLIGQNVRTLTGGQKLARVTGLDSAGPMFCHPVVANYDERISSDDADYVDAIHTSGSDLGCDVPYGTANFFPNCGKIQSGCAPANLTIGSIEGSFKSLLVQGSCSHLRAFRFWLESINSDGFKAKSCDICAKNSPTACEKPTEKANLQIMGEHSSPLAKGNYYLTTKPSSPFAEE